MLGLWRVRCRDEWIYVYILIEFQSTVDRFMAVRLMTYIGLLYQDLIRTGLDSGMDVGTLATVQSAVKCEDGGRSISGVRSGGILRDN